MASIKSNILLNGLNTVTGILFPVITFPYAARVLLPEGIGAVNFLNSVVNYIILLTSLGIPMYAVKEIAKYNDDKNQRDAIAVEIILLSTLLCVLGYIGVFLLAELVPQIHQQSALFYILSFSIVFTAIGVNWFYQGIEDFKFITTRAIIIRSLSAAALFIFVKDSTDLLIYGIITVGSTVGNNAINFIHLHKHLSISSIRVGELKIFRHLGPALQVFILNLITSLYIQLNSVMLGFMSGDDAVGYYTAGTRISHIGLTLIGSLGTVLLPRCSHLLKIGDNEGFSKVICKSLNLTLAIALPLSFGLMMLGRPVTLIFCGDGYVEAIPVFILNAPVILFVSLTNLMGIQILYPMDKIKIVICSVSGGALLNLILNVLLIPSMGATGAAISTLAAEIIVLLIQLLLGSDYYPFKLKSLFNGRYILATLIMGMFVYAITLIVKSQVLELLFGSIVGFIAYISILISMKDKLTVETINLIMNKIHRKQSY